MLIDSHCHLHLMDATLFEHGVDTIIEHAKDNNVMHFLCVSVDLKDYEALCTLADKYPCVSISVGLHPNEMIDEEPSLDRLIGMASQHPQCIAIGETGLDFYRTTEHAQQALQMQRFRNHIHAAIQTRKPLIIHTRDAAADTLRILKEENANQIGGVMHCFSENWEIAKAALDMNFYISFSGIVTFKNAVTLQEVAQKVPLDRILIETDSPYLAPVPHRGKPNEPAFVKHVAEKIAELRNISYEDVATASTENFKRCFRSAVVSAC